MPNMGELAQHDQTAPLMSRNAHGIKPLALGLPPLVNAVGRGQGEDREGKSNPFL